MTPYGRKFELVMIGLTIATLALFLRITTFDAWSLFALGDIGLYFGANVFQKKVEAGCK
jgi:hypothetical protein